MASESSPDTTTIQNALSGCRVRQGGQAGRQPDRTTHSSRDRSRCRRSHAVGRRGRHALRHAQHQPLWLRVGVDLGDRHRRWDRRRRRHRRAGGRAQHQQLQLVLGRQRLAGGSSPALIQVSDCRAASFSTASRCRTRRCSTSEAERGRVHRLGRHDQDAVQGDQQRRLRADLHQRAQHRRDRSRRVGQQRLHRVQQDQRRRRPHRHQGIQLDGREEPDHRPQSPRGRPRHLRIGSEFTGGVSEVKVYDISIDQTASGTGGGSSNGLRIKSDSSRGGLVNARSPTATSA